MKELVQELNRIRDEVILLLDGKGTRYTPDEIAEVLGADKDVVETVLKSLYADRQVEPIYVYRRFKGE